MCAAALAQAMLLSLIAALGRSTPATKPTMSRAAPERSATELSAITKVATRTTTLSGGDGSGLLSVFLRFRLAAFLDDVTKGRQPRKLRRSNNKKPCKAP